MRGRTVEITWREGDDEAALRRLYQNESDGRVRSRLHLLWLVRQGKQVQQTAQLVGAHERTARQWVAWYRQGGTDLVRGKRRGGRGQTARLSHEQQEQLRAHVSAHGFTSAKDALAWIEKQPWGVRYTEGGLYSLFRRLRIKKKVPRPQNVKADLAVQQAFKKGAWRLR